MLTTAQYQALKAAILADQVLSAQPNNPDGNSAIAALLNAVAVPDFVVWRTAVSREEIHQNGFDWVRVDNLSVGKARIWEWLFQDGPINPSKPNIRLGIDETWKGTAADLAVRDVVYTHCKRLATRAEKLLATGTGSTVSPASLGFEGQLTYQDMEFARSL